MILKDSRLTIEDGKEGRDSCSRRRRTCPIGHKKYDLLGTIKDS